MGDKVDYRLKRAHDRQQAVDLARMRVEGVPAVQSSGGEDQNPNVGPTGWLADELQRASREWDAIERIYETDGADWIVSVAIRCNGLILSMPRPARHCDILKQMHAKDARNCRPSDQGFLTCDGKFVGREEGLRIAREAKQLKSPTPKRELFSEELW